LVHHHRAQEHGPLARTISALAASFTYLKNLASMNKIGSFVRGGDRQLTPPWSSINHIGHVMN
jgi:hypothetical protein